MAVGPFAHLSARHRLAVIAVIAVAAALRFGAIGAGAPYRIANDEPFVVGMALKILQSGDFNPHFFHYGGLAIYLHTAVAVVRFLAGAVSGEFTSVNGIWIGDFLTAARMATAALGTLTVWLVYRAGMRLSPRVALMAAFIMAVVPQHVRESHFALTDTPLTLFVAAALVLSLRAVEQSRLSALAVAAFVVGLAASVKYNGALALTMPLLASLAMPMGSRLRGIGLAILCAGGGFLITSPYTVLDLPAFLNDFARLSQSYNQGRPFLDASAVYAKHLRNWFAWTTVAPLDAGLGALVLGFLGGWLIAFRRNVSLSRTGAAMVLVFPIIWFVVLARQGSLQYGRYLLPLAPMLCLALATTLVAGWTRASQLAGTWRWGLRAVVVVIVLLPTGAAVTWVRDHARPRTEELASAWLVRELQAGERVVVEAAAILLPPSITMEAVDRLVDRPLSDYVDQGVTYLVTTAAETDPYFALPAAHADELSAYRQLVSRTQPVATLVANGGTLGPTITILRVRP